MQRKYHHEYDMDIANYLIKQGFKIVGSGYGKRDNRAYVVFKVTQTFYPTYNLYDKNKK